MTKMIVIFSQGELEDFQEHFGMIGALGLQNAHKPNKSAQEITMLHTS